MALIGNIVSIVFKGFRGLSLPLCVQDIAIAWYQDLNNVKLVDNSVTVMDFDGSNDFISLSSVPDVTGSKTISFKFRVDTTPAIAGYIIQFGTGTDYCNVAYSSTDKLVVQCSGTDTGSTDLNITLGQIYEIQITKTTGTTTAIELDGVPQVVGGSVISAGPTTGDTIGNLGGSSRYHDGVVYNVLIASTHQWNGTGVNANQNSAWEDQIGAIDGTVNGTPTTVTIVDSISRNIEEFVGTRERSIYYGQNLASTSGQINIYRTTGTYDWTDPTTGVETTGVSIPGTGLITVPANGICEIKTSDGSRYPVCERAGTVLHDVNENAIHISVSSPVWEENLYGSDYLNQIGFVTESDYNNESYTWESVVDGSPIALDSDTLVPAADPEYAENTLDGGMDLIL